MTKALLVRMRHRGDTLDTKDACGHAGEYIEASVVGDEARKLSLSHTRSHTIKFSSVT